jgi:hypothetical protein
MKIYSPQIIGSLEVVGNSTMTGSLSVTGSNITLAQGSKLIGHDIQAAAVNGIEIDNNTGNPVALFGAGGSQGATFYGQINGTTFVGTASLATSASQAVSSSFATTASYALNAGGAAFPYTGSAIITGSLILTGSATMGAGGSHYNAINIQNRGTTNTITADGNSIGTIAIGHSNITGKGAALFMGYANIDQNYANGQDNGAIGWQNVFSTGNFTSRNLILGSGNSISGDGNYRVVVGGNVNSQEGGSYGAVVGGNLNRITTGNNGAILGGTSNTASHDNSVVIGGANITTAAASTVYVPNFNVSGSSTFKASTVFSGSVRGEVNALSITSNTASLNCALDNFFTLQLVAGTDTRIEPSNILPGQTINLRVNTTGSATVSFPTSVKQVSGSAYVPTTTTGVDIVTFIAFDNSSLFLSNVKNLV